MFTLTVFSGGVDCKDRRKSGAGAKKALQSLSSFLQPFTPVNTPITRGIIVTASGRITLGSESNIIGEMTGFLISGI
jgi:hypothetical protein